MKKSHLILLLIIIIATAGIVWKTTQPQATVQVIKAATRTLNAYIEEQAATELPNDYLIAMPIDGWLEPITLREGDRVTAGEVVAKLDDADLSDRVRQAKHRVAVLETKISKTGDNRLEEHALVDAEATVKAIDETVAASEAKLQAYIALSEFAKSELTRLLDMKEKESASDREIREAQTGLRKAKAEQRGNALDLAALKTIAAVSYIGPQFIRDVIDRKSFELETLKQQLAEAKTELEIQERNQQRAAIASPINGVVLERLQTRRQFLPAGTPLLTIGKLDDMEVIAEVLTQRATRIQKGNKVEIFGEAIIGENITGEVLRVYPAGFTKISSLGVEQQRVNVAIKLAQRPENLGIGYRLQVRIHYDQAPNALTLPRTAIFRNSKGNWQVMIVSKYGKTELRTINLGLMNDSHAQIIGGISADDLVIAKPSKDITEQMKVETFFN